MCSPEIQIANNDRVLNVLRQDYEDLETKLEELISNQLGAEEQVQRRIWLESNQPTNDNDVKLLTKVKMKYFFWV